MMPLGISTQQFIPTQPTLVATALPGSIATRPAFDAVAPSVSNASITPDHKGTGSYVSPLLPNAVAPSPMLLSVPMPGSFGTSVASLNASTMFAAQSLAQDIGTAPALFEQYAALVAASEVKYKPSNATLPEPEIRTVFAKMLEQDKAVSVRVAGQNISQAVQGQVSAQQSSANPVTRTPEKPASAGKSSDKVAVRSEAILAFNAYHATVQRNESLEKEVPETEAL